MQWVVLLVALVLLVCCGLVSLLCFCCVGLGCGVFGFTGCLFGLFVA